MKKKHSRKSRKQRLENQEKIWLLRPAIKIPKGQNMKSIRDYNRKREKDIKRFINEH